MLPYLFFGSILYVGVDSAEGCGLTVSKSYTIAVAIHACLNALITIEAMHIV